MTERPTTFDQLLANGKVLVADGGMGTSLFGLGLANGESPELLNVIDPDMVVKAHRGFVEARVGEGAQGVGERGPLWCDPRPFCGTPQVHFARRSALCKRAYPYRSRAE